MTLLHTHRDRTHTQKKSSKVYLRRPRIRAVKKFRRIRFGDSRQWKLLNPQNKTLLFAQDIKGYWCKEHRKGMPRIQAVISHYKHNHNGAKISDAIEFQDAIISDKPGKVLSTKKQRERENRIMISKIFDRLKHKGPVPDWVRDSKDVAVVREEKEEWWVIDKKKVIQELEEKISDYELLKKAKDAGIPKIELDNLRMQLGIPEEDIYDKNMEFLKKLYIAKKLIEQ